jgi:uncharacterized membrane protein
MRRRSIFLSSTRGKPMKNCTAIRRLLGCALTFIAAANAADAPPLTIKFNTVNVPGAIQTMPGGVNNAGVIVGQFEDKEKLMHGYILNGKKLTKLDEPNGTGTGANSINFNGVIRVVGSYTNSSGNSEGFLYQNGKFTDVPGPATAVASFALGINDAGEIVGGYTDSSGAQHGFLLKAKKYATLDVPGAIGLSTASGINNKGIIVLYWLDSQNALDSSLYNGKTYKKIDVPGVPYSAAAALNNEGDVSYTWLDLNFVDHGALFHGGKYYKFIYPKSVQTYGGGINDHQVFVGGYQAKDGGPFQGFTASY